jgi:hypothetical protein
VPLVTEPNDLIIFSARTYHAAFPTPVGYEPRLSAGFMCRSGAELEGPPCPWALPPAAQDFVTGLPMSRRRFMAGYTSIDLEWDPAASPSKL